MNMRCSVVEMANFRGLESDSAYQMVCGDCLAGLRRLPRDGIGVVVTSPPYNQGIAYGDHCNDRRERADYLAWSEAWLGEVLRVLEPEGALFLNLGASTVDPLLPFEMILAATRLGFRLQNTIHWVKSISIEADGEVVSRGHFKPLSSARFLNACHEYVFHLTRSGRVRIDRRAAGVPYADKSNVRRWAHTGGQDRRCRGNVWFVPYETIRERNAQRPHPATFPVRLVEQCLRLHGRREGVLLDPFLGIGSSALAARRYGMSGFVGIERSETFVREAHRRWQREAGGESDGIS